jgi:hypothetical protein
MTRQTPKPKTPGEHPTSTSLRFASPRQDIQNSMWTSVVKYFCAFIRLRWISVFAQLRRDKPARQGVEGDGGTSNTQHRIQPELRSCRSAPVLGRSNCLLSSHRTFPNRPPIPLGCGRDGRTSPTQKFNFGVQFKNVFFRSSRGNEAQISLETIIRSEPPHQSSHQVLRPGRRRLLLL